MKLYARLTGAAALCLAMSTSALAQSADTIVVFDGSGSMWGQIDGRTKIEIARNTLSTVLSDVPAQNRIGMIAYGHRQNGVCTDIETIVPVGPAEQSVPQMIDAANGLKPKGKTPLSDAVRIAAEQLKYTENAATVVLVTDGIETCNADPCALATELENAGIGFTTHVVGFGLSQEEGRQVQCLADNTGGLYLSANNADELGSALRQTVQAQPIAPDPSDFEPLETKRSVRFIFRDTPQTEQIGVRHLSGYLEKLDTGEKVAEDDFQFSYPEAHGNSAVGELKPGRYVGIFRRDGSSGNAGYDARFEFEIPEGTGEYLVEASLSGALTIDVFINPEMPLAKGDPFPTAVGGSRRRVHFEIFPVEDGEVADAPVAKANMDSLTQPLSPGLYLIRGNIDSGTSAERLVEVKAGEATEYDFSFDATRVFVDARQTNGAPVERQTTYWYDKMRSGRNYWVRGGGRSDGELTPFYLPTGRWLVNTGGEGTGARRSEVLVTIPGTYEDMRLEIGESETLSEAEIAFLNERGEGCLEILKVGYGGCLVERADLTTAERGGSEETGIDDGPPPVSDSDSASETGSALDGLGGTAYAFADRNTEPKLHIVFAPGDRAKAMVVLSNAWCGSAQCEADRFPIEYDEVDLLLEDTVAASAAGANGYSLNISSFGHDKEIAVSGAGASRVRFTFMDKIELDGAAQNDVSQEGDAP